MCGGDEFYNTPAAAAAPPLQYSYRHTRGTGTRRRDFLLQIDASLLSRF